MMRQNSKFITVLFLLFTLIFMYQETEAQPKKPKTKKTPVLVETKPLPPEVNYTVSMSKPWTHLLEVEMRVKQSKLSDKTELVMPVWTPGSYLVREYARHVEDFSAKDSSGNSLTWAKVNKNTWSVDSKGLTEFTVNYNVYSNELTVRTNELNDNHAFFTPAALLFFPRGYLDVPSTISVKPYKDWKVATGLPKVEGKENTFVAENYDVLYDSPFEIGNHKEISFEVQGKMHRFVVNGEGNYDLNRIAKDTTKIIEECSKIFGDLPYKDYLFILNTRGGGGLEHLNSTALQWNKFGFTTRYTDFLSLVVHEFFHLWNVKRIKPDVLGPFNYEAENYTKLLWVAEGATAYYEGVIMQRAGLISDKDALAIRANQIQALQDRPGRFETSLEESSFDAWIKYYRQDQNAVNNQISYYDKGELVNFLLDLQIRKDSNGAKSLDDVFRYLYNEIAKKGKNFTPEDYKKTCELMAGKPLDNFFNKYVSGREEINYDEILNAFGLRLDISSGRQNAYLGATLAQEGERLMVKTVPQGTPAYEQGLNFNDQIVAVDGHRATLQFLNTYLGEKKANDKVKLSIFRFDELREMEMVLGGKGITSYRIVSTTSPTDEQKALYQGYFAK
jgi:predicted metalloprotease with PDZ domain